MRKIITRYKAPNKIFGCPANEVKTETGKTEVYEYAKWLIQVANDHYVPLVAKDE